MLKTIAAIAVSAFIVKRTSPETYDKAVRALNDIIDTASDVTTAARGQAKAYCAEACKDASERLQSIDPQAIETLRAMLDGTAPSQQPARPVPHRRRP